MNFDVKTIMSILPHRYPMLLIDRVTELVPLQRACGYKNVTANEPAFMGHFPGNPLFPGVYMIEALAQLGGMMVLEPGDASNKTPYLVGIERAKFRRPVIPGDCLKMETILVKARSGIGFVEARASVDDKPVCEAKLMYSIVATPGPLIASSVFTE